MPKTSNPNPQLSVFEQVVENTNGVPETQSRLSKNLSTQQKVDRALAKIKQKTIATADQNRRKHDTLTLQEVFPMWDDSNRGVPNPFIRSGLFSVKNNEERTFMKGLKVASLSNYVVTYTGMDLSQDDLSVWLALINLARQQPLCDSILFTGYSLIKDLGWTMNKNSYTRAQESITRLKVTGIEIINCKAGEGYSGSLIREFAWTAMDANGNARWMVAFEPRVFALFVQDTTTLIEWETRRMIGSRATVALWLHSFYSSHQDPIPMGVAKIFELCRSDSSLSSFRHTLKRSLEKLITVGFLTSYSLEKDIIVVRKKIRSKGVLAANSKAVLTSQ